MFHISIWGVVHLFGETKLNEIVATGLKKTTSGMGFDEHRLLFRQTCETNSETRFLLKFLNVGDTLNLLNLVFVSSS